MSFSISIAQQNRAHISYVRNALIHFHFHFNVFLGHTTKPICALKLNWNCGKQCKYKRVIKCTKLVWNIETQNQFKMCIRKLTIRNWQVYNARLMWKLSVSMRSRHRISLFKHYALTHLHTFVHFIMNGNAVMWCEASALMTHLNHTSHLWVFIWNISDSSWKSSLPPAQQQQQNKNHGIYRNIWSHVCEERVKYRWHATFQISSNMFPNIFNFLEIREAQIYEMG